MPTMLSLYRLDFLNNVHNPGPNVTVRYGDKWSRALRVHDRIQIGETGQDMASAVARVKGIFCLPFGDIPQGLLDIEHDPACTTRTGLIEAMQKAYPDFDESTECTVVVYALLGDESPPEVAEMAKEEKENT